MKQENGLIGTINKSTGEQQYKFGGKELDMANGLNEYDLGARRYYQGVPTFTQPDPMAENFPWHSSYVYCGNNPVNLIDPTGKEEYGINVNGNLVEQGSLELFDFVYILDLNGIPTGKFLVLPANSITPDLGLLTHNVALSWTRSSLCRHADYMLKDIGI